MGGKNKAPAPPDYSQLAAASERAAEFSYKIGVQQLAWAREQYKDDQNLLAKVIDASMARQSENDRAALSDRQRYEDSYLPLEDRSIKEAMDYDSPERTRYEMGRAGAEVAANFDAQRRAAAESLESYGVDPSSTRFAALDIGMRAQQAAAQAGAENQARVGAEATGRAIRSEAINVGRGLPGQIAGTYATALQSGGQAANTALAGSANGASIMGTAPQYMNLQNQALGTWGNVMNMGYNNQLAQFNANQQSSSGLGSLLGAGLGAIGNAGGMAAFFEDGGAVPHAPASSPAAPARGALPVTPGGNVPPAASPSRGAAVDDVPARLNVGEFVVPKEAVSWFGEKHFQQLIEKSRKERAGATAKPQFRPAAPMQRPAGGMPAAIPV